MEKPKLIFNHPLGNANSRAVLEGVAREGLLDEFHTSVAAFNSGLWSALARTRLGQEFNRRRFAEDVRRQTRQKPFRELGRIAANRLGLSALTTHETGRFSVDAVFRGLDRRVARRLGAGRGRAVYAYEDGALHSFRAAKNQGVSCFYDLPIGYWRTARRLLSQEVERWPEWIATMPGFRDSEDKLARKDEELRLADAIFVASSFTASTLKDFPEGGLAPVHVIPYGFPTPPEQLTAENPGPDTARRKLKILFVGGLSQRKGIADVFAVADALRKDTELTVVGRGPVDRCLALRDALKRHHWIPSLPHDEVLAQMREHDVLLFPSLFEGFGLVITEAMSQGTPVITTERTAGADLITPGHDGWIVPAGDTPALQKQVEALVHNPGLARTAGRNALEKARTRPWSAYGDELAAKLVELMPEMV